MPNDFLTPEEVNDLYRMFAEVPPVQDPMVRPVAPGGLPPEYVDTVSTMSMSPKSVPQALPPVFGQGTAPQQAKLPIVKPDAKEPPEKTEEQKRRESIKSLFKEAGGEVPLSQLPRGLPEPFEEAASMEQARKAIDRKRALTSVSEGLVKAGRGMSGMAAGPVRPEFGEPFVAEQTREDVFREEDKLTPAESEFLRTNLGLEIPAGYDRSKLVGMFPKLAATMGTMRGVDLRQQNLEEMRKRTENLQEYRWKLPDASMKKITDMKNTFDGLSYLNEKWEQLHPEADDKFNAFGSAMQRLNRAILAPGGVGDEERAALEASAGQLFAAYVKSISGAQVSQAEFERLARNLPQTTFSPKAFKAVLETFVNKLQREYHNELDFYGKRGHNVEQFREGIPRNEAAQVNEQGATPSAGAPSTTPEGMVPMISPSGKRGFIPKDQMQAAIDKGFSLAG